MGSIYKTSQTSVITADPNQRYVYVLQAENPEEALVRYLRDFLKTVGFSSIFPNFNNIRIGSVHPFAILLAQDVLGQKQSTNQFPSITIGDSSASEDAEVLGNDYRTFSMDAEEIVALGGYRDSGKIFCSDEGWTKIQEQVDSIGHIVGILRRYHTQHNMDFNIWSENKEVTSFLYDMVMHFITQRKADIHNELGYDFSSVSGRRSGDINLDFGTMLYGANVSAQMSMDHEAILFDTGVVNISEIDTQSLPEYFVLGAVNG
jgi:hypothetical protein